MGRSIVFAFAVLLVAQAAAGQSLAEVARREAERRKTVAKASKIYTNDDLRPSGQQTRPAQPASPDAATAPPAAAKPSVEQDTSPPASADEPAKDEAYWRKRITDARASLERTVLLIAALDSRVNALTSDWSARDDPAQRALLSQDRLKAVAELERTKKEREAQEKAIKDIEEEARQAGVPPGWLR
jgi:hypothetical protein